MKIIIQKEDLLYAVNAVEKAVSNKNILPILSGILIIAKEGRVSFRATDLDLAIECGVTGQVLEDGEAVVPGKKFSAFVRLLPNGNITLSTKDKRQMDISYAESVGTVPCFDPSEFPMLPPMEGELSGRLPVRAFRRLVRQVSIAAAQDEVRPVFSGVYCEFEGQDLIFVATDTHRLAKSQAEWNNQNSGSLIFPLRVLQEIARLAVDDDDEITLIANKNQVFFSFANLIFTSKLIVGQYPDFRQVIPKSELFTTTLLVEKGPFADALERAALISRSGSQKNSSVRLEIRETGLRVLAETPDEGMIDEKLPCALSGEEMDINYNVRYVQDALRVIDSQRIVMKLTSSTTPGLVFGDEDAGQEYLYLLLPVRVNR